VERSAAANSSPSVLVLRTDGTEQTIDCAKLNAEFVKGGDRELFRRLTGSDATVVDEKRKKRRKRVAKAGEVEGEAEGEEGGEEGGEAAQKAKEMR
jgi:hypothetical protein